jgi:hypothetical protein
MRNTQARSVSIPYRVGIRPRDGAPAAEAIRAVYDELSKVAQALADYDRPNATIVGAQDDLNVDANPPFERLFDTGVAVDWERPGGSLDTTTGIWTCQQEGLYHVICKVTVSPLNASASKSYTVEVRTTIDHLDDWLPDAAPVSYGGGLDDQYINAIAILTLPLARGDRLWFDARAIHPNKTGTEPCACNLQIVRQSGIGSTR